MRRQLTVAGVLVVATANAGPVVDWTTHRDPAAGYTLSFPASLSVHAHAGGTSATLVDRASGDALVEIGLWPPDVCPREPAGTTARGLGLQRAVVVTRADGPSGSSSCDEPASVRERRSKHDVPYWEVTLVCDDGRRKGPTSFANVSQAWRTRVLMLDPVGADPRRPEPARPVDPSLMRDILDTIAVLSAARPPGRRIDELR